MEIGFLEFLNFLLKGGWVVLPILLFLAWKHVWMDYIHMKYDLSINWVTLELKLPKVVEKTPKSMEQIFIGLYSIRSMSNLRETYIYGKHQLHICVDVTSINGDIHFFIRTPDNFRALIESQVHSQYPEADIVEVEDYTKMLPENIPNEEYDLWGTEFLFTKHDAYPIQTYKKFKEDMSVSIDTKQFVDPISSLMEVFVKMREGEQIWLSYIIRPSGDDWQKEGRKIIEEMLSGKTKKSTPNIVEEVFQFFSDLVWIFFGKAPKDEVKEEKVTVENKNLTPGDMEVIKAIEESITKHGFHTNIRVIYLAKRDVFSRANIPAILGTFNQFSSFNLNGFRPNPKISPGSSTPFFANTINRFRKIRLYNNAREKEFKDADIILNTEELATLYHIPSSVVETPTLPKVETKKVQPPSGLPVA